MFNSYGFIIAASLVVVISYFFNIISRKTQIPSVLLLIALGVGIKEALIISHFPELNFFPVLEILGIVGLVMIVLEAALELELRRDKLPIITRAFWVAFIAVLANTVLISVIIYYFLNISVLPSLIYAVPLSIISSAIVIPSIGKLDSEKREFMIYESTFSDIWGIMFFYFLLGSRQAAHTGELVLGLVGNISITIIISLLVSYMLILIFQRLKTHIKLFLLIAALLIIYSSAKLLHLSSLLIILIFGLFLRNKGIFFKGKLRRFLREKEFDSIVKNFVLITAESAFVIRTFFFVIFGITISFASLMNVNVLIISTLIVVGIFLLRYILLRLLAPSKLRPGLYIAPRGLITVLLFFSIPKEFQYKEFEQGILFFTIIVSCIVMASSLMRYRKETLEGLLAQINKKK